MNLRSAAIWLFGGLAGIGTLAMIFEKNLLRAALYMLAVLTATAGIYAALNANLLAFLQLILYAGAIMVLFIVAISVLPSGGISGRARPLWVPVAGAAAAALMLARLGVLALAGPRAQPVFPPEQAPRLSLMMFGRYTFQLELVSLLLFAGIVGAVAAAKRRL